VKKPVAPINLCFQKYQQRIQAVDIVVCLHLLGFQLITPTAQLG
jgi:hypothetical protein